MEAWELRYSGKSGNSSRVPRHRIGPESVVLLCQEYINARINKKSSQREFCFLGCCRDPSVLNLENPGLRQALDLRNPSRLMVSPGDGVVSGDLSSPSGGSSECPYLQGASLQLWNERANRDPGSLLFIKPYILLQGATHVVTLHICLSGCLSMNNPLLHPHPTPWRLVWLIELIKVNNFANRLCHQTAKCWPKWLPKVQRGQLMSFWATLKPCDW